jgi:multiple sugar transport system substrate-binding protein
MKKKLISILLAAAMVAALATGCGNKTAASASKSSDSGKETLKVWLPPLDDNTEKNWGGLLKDWEKKNNCTVKLTIIPWDKYEETYMTALNSGEGPDVGYMYNEMFPTYIDSGAVTDMSKYVTAADKKEYKYLNNGNLMNGQYGWPIVTGVPFILYYNQDILDKLGEKAPTTWEDFTRICKKATQDTNGDGKIDQYGFACGMNTSDVGAMQILNAYYYSALWQNGGKIYADDLKSVTFADKAGTEAMTWLKSLTQYMNPDFMSQSWPDAFTNVFGAGKAAFGVNRSSQTDETTYAKTYPKLKWNYVTSLKNVDYGTFGATDCLTLMSAAKDKDLAMNFIKYVTGADFMKQYHAKCPGATLTESEPYVGDEKMARIYNEDKDKWHGLQAGPCGTDILTQLASNFQGILSGETSVADGLKEAQTYANGQLKDYWANKK